MASLVPTGGEIVIVPHSIYEGIFTAKGVEDVVLTKNLVPGQAIYNDIRVTVQNEDGTQVEYKLWNPFSSNLSAAIICEPPNIYIKPGSKVLYLGGAACGATLSLVSDIIGPTGLVYAVVEPDLVNMLPNVIPIIEDPRYPAKYSTLVEMVDVIFSDIDQPDQGRILVLNASHYLKIGGHFLLSIKGSCIDSTRDPIRVIDDEVVKLMKEQFNPQEETPLDLFENDHHFVTGGYKMHMLETQLQGLRLSTLKG